MGSSAGVIERFRSRVRHACLAFGCAAALLGCGARTELPPGVVEPTCDGLQVQSVRVGEVKQMDLLFVIDNSLSMADKQELLRDAIPALVRRLANPLCVSISDPNLELPLGSIEGSCPAGFRREFEALEDMHIAVITSSLGTSGGKICTGDSEQLDDRAHLLATRPRAAFVPTYQGLGFLDWDPKADHLPPGESDISALERNFGELVGLAGEAGCGYEATLEAWYRFLIDPAPAEQVVVDEQSIAHPRGLDRALLAQRAAFLRPDSLVAVIMLSDENDCSILQGGQGWLVGATTLGGQNFVMPAATTACASNPNSPCCRSCSSATPSGCQPASDDSSCDPGVTSDPTNLRCFDQKRRFGVDLLYPTARYAVGLRSRTLCPDSIYQDGDCTCAAARERAKNAGQPAPACSSRETGKPVANPLFQNLSGAPAFERDVSQVFLAGILGVPWQDIATTETRSDPTRLEYLTASDLGRFDPAIGADRWQLILGDPSTLMPPLDPFMRESVGSRAGQNPLTGHAIVAESSVDPKATLNGHERDTNGMDLQYACTFPLAVARDCSQVPPGTRCDCREGRPTDPICQPPTGGIGGTTQYFAKAYPSLRELDVLRQHGANSVVASICPKTLSGVNPELEFGYRPAIAGLIKRLHCANLDGDFETDPGSADYGTVNCRLIGVTEPTGQCACNGVTRLLPGEAEQAVVRRKLETLGLCGRNTGKDCAAFCACEVPQTRGAGLEACQNDSSEAPRDPDSSQAVNGWCYVDPANGFGSPSLVQDCPAANPRNLRVLGSAAPQPKERLFSVCGDSCMKASP
jgi:hypothetical protein